MAKKPTGGGKKGSLYLHPNRKKAMKRPEQIVQTGIAEKLYKLEALCKGEDFYFFHVPNGGYRTPAEASILKGMGVRAGIPDIWIMYPQHNRIIYMAGRECLSLYDSSLSIIELKVGENSSARKTQKDFAVMAEKFGFDRHLVHAKDINDGIIQTLRIMLPKLNPTCLTAEIIKQYVFPGGIKI